MTGSSAFPWNQARFDAGELITQRELVSRQVSDDLTERAATFGLILDDVSLVRVLGSLGGGGWGCLAPYLGRYCEVLPSTFLDEDLKRWNLLSGMRQSPWVSFQMRILFPPLCCRHSYFDFWSSPGGP